MTVTCPECGDQFDKSDPIVRSAVGIGQPTKQHAVCPHCNSPLYEIDGKWHLDRSRRGTTTNAD